MGLEETFLSSTWHSKLCPTFCLLSSLPVPTPLPPRHNKYNPCGTHQLKSLYWIPTHTTSSGPGLGISIGGTNPLGDSGVELLVGPVLSDVIKMAVKVHKVLVSPALH